jgi:hypothetical protein
MTIAVDKCRETLVATVQRIVDESGDPAGFDAVAWVDAWMVRRLPALGGLTPHAFVLSGQDCDVLVSLLLCMQSGAFC